MNLVFHRTKAGTVNLQLVDVSGKVIAEKTALLSIGNQTFQWNGLEKFLQVLIRILHLRWKYPNHKEL